MAPRLEPLDIGDKPVPGRFLLTNIHATDRMFGGEIQSYRPSLVLDKSRAPSKVERDFNTPLPITEAEYLIWVIGKGRLYVAPFLSQPYPLLLLIQLLGRSFSTL